MVAGNRASILHAQTTAPLAANGVYDSTWQQVKLYPLSPSAASIPVYHDRTRIRGAVVADQGSGVNGFQVHMANRDDRSDSYVAFQATLAVNTVQTFDAAITGKWVRVELTNGAVAQGTLTLTGFLEDD